VEAQNIITAIMTSLFFFSWVPVLVSPLAWWSNKASKPPSARVADQENRCLSYEKCTCPFFPGMVATGNFGSTYNINMTISGVGLVGSLAYSVTYNMSGDATLSNETQTTATDSANWVPVITATLSLNAAPGVGLGGTGNAGATAFSASFNINE